jgi:hypothetical protein
MGGNICSAIAVFFEVTRKSRLLMLSSASISAIAG